MVFKATISQSFVTLVRPDSRYRRAESLNSLISLIISGVGNSVFKDRSFLLTRPSCNLMCYLKSLKKNKNQPTIVFANLNNVYKNRIN